MTNKLSTQKPVEQKRQPPKPREEMDAYIDEQGQVVIRFINGVSREWLIEWDFREGAKNDQ